METTRWCCEEWKNRVQLDPVPDLQREVILREPDNGYHSVGYQTYLVPGRKPHIFIVSAD